MNAKLNGKRILLFIFLAALLLGVICYFFGSSAREHRDRLFSAPIDTVTSIRISPGDNKSLVVGDVIITNRGTIQKIMAAIRSATNCLPDHPSTRWQCRLVISHPSGEDYATLHETAGQGAIIFCTTSRDGFIFDTLQSTDLSAVLESAARKQEGDR
jgi:hypothetical protein